MRTLSGIKRRDNTLLIKRQQLINASRPAPLVTLLQLYAAQKEALRAEIEAERQVAVQAGFTLGVEQVIPALVAFVQQYEARQRENGAALRQHLLETLQTSLQSPLIADEIVAQLLASCSIKADAPTRVVLPRGMRLPESLAGLSVAWSDDHSFSVEQGAQILHFPASEQCHQWLQQAESRQPRWQPFLGQLRQTLLAALTAPSNPMLANEIPPAQSENSNDEPDSLHNAGPAD